MGGGGKPSGGGGSNPPPYVPPATVAKPKNVRRGSYRGGNVLTESDSLGRPNIAKPTLGA